MADDAVDIHKAPNPRLGQAPLDWPCLVHRCRLVEVRIDYEGKDLTDKDVRESKEYERIELRPEFKHAAPDTPETRDKMLRNGWFRTPREAELAALAAKEKADKKAGRGDAALLMAEKSVTLAIE